MSRELTQNERRLAVLGAIALLWGACLVTIGFTLTFVAVVVGGLLLVAIVGLQGRAIVAAVKPRAHQVGGRLRGATGERVRAHRPDRLGRQARNRGTPRDGCESGGGERLSACARGRRCGCRRGRVARTGRAA